MGTPLTTPFVFVCCQGGAEAALKAELARLWPTLRLAFSRPGFVTFRIPEELRLPLDFDLRSVFARAGGWSLGRVHAPLAEQGAFELWSRVASRTFHHLHVWQREGGLAGNRETHPSDTALVEEVAAIIWRNRPCSSGTEPLPVNQKAAPGQIVLDCVLVEPNEWWVGFHSAAAGPSRWPGGAMAVAVPPHAVSRAYAKMVEALDWSRLPVARNDRCVEIGSAPGGSSQALLDRGLRVTGVDPAQMDEAILQHANFRHVQKRGGDLKRREYGGFQWLFVDSNVAPQETLAMVESIVTHQGVDIRGLLLTLKFSDWPAADRLPEFLDRVRTWGYGNVRARQLASNRQEVCVAAQKSRSATRAARTSLRRPTRETASLRSPHGCDK